MLEWSLTYDLSHFSLQRVFFLTLGMYCSNFNEMKTPVQVVIVGSSNKCRWWM